MARAGALPGLLHPPALPRKGLTSLILADPIGSSYSVESVRSTTELLVQAVAPHAGRHD